MRFTRYHANVVSHGCPQNCGLDPSYCPATTSEDCLFLTVTAPLDAPPGHSPGYPVMLWIHGGAFVTGYASGCPLYNVASFALNNVIVVTISYRLGAVH